MYIVLQVKYPLLLSDFNGRQIFENYCNIKFHDNPSSGSRVIPRGRIDRQSWRS